MAAADRIVHNARQVDELASILAAAYLRLLAARDAVHDRRNPLDSPEQESDELAMTPTRRRRRA